jgi:flagellar motility protein MotE (MotC chaperone)
MNDKNVNGLDYWNERFELDWTQNQGQKQSRFFGMVACRLFPEWFVGDVNAQGATFCDWGCAMGDGTKFMRDCLGLERVTGIDFSEIAIAEARKHYPEIEFDTEDLLAEVASRRFNVIFSSNTLEHFHEPWRAADKLAALADDYFVMLVPFQEPAEDRHEEHFYSFEWNNLRRRLAGRLDLIYASVIDASELPDPQWGGKQVLAIYAGPHALTRVGDMLAERGEDWPGKFGNLHDQSVQMRAELDATIRQRNGLGYELIEARNEKETMREEQAQQLQVAADLRERIGQLQASLNALETEHAQLRTAEMHVRDQLISAENELGVYRQKMESDNAALIAQIGAIHKSNSWRITAPLRALGRLFR